MSGYLDVVGIGDSLEYLKQIPDNTIDSVVSDAPYGLGKAPDPAVVMMAWARGRDVEVGGGGFMSARWDAFVPQPSMWREVIRVLKPGGYALVFFGTRTVDWGAIAMRFAGFEIVDTITYLYGVGFPKSLDIAKAIDKRAGVEPVEVRPSHETGILSPNSDWNPCHNQIVMPPPTTDEAKTWTGWGTQLKPSHEPVVVARKPLASDGYIDNVIEHGTGAFNIDECRVGNDKVQTRINTSIKGGNFSSGGGGGDGSPQEVTEHTGRWPANVMLSHLPECELIGTKRVDTGTAVKRNLPPEGASQQLDFKARSHRRPDQGYAGADGKEEVEDWRCAEGCPVAEIDRQGSERGVHGAGHQRQAVAGGAYNASSYDLGQPRRMDRYGDGGGPSRFFYTAKASTKERWAYCKVCRFAFQHSPATFKEHEEHRKEVISHPTQKPLELMRYLIRLVTQEGGVVLDPYCGTGTTALAAKQLGYHFVTCELSGDYAKIAQTRLAQVGSSTAQRLQSGAYFCPGCQDKGVITLLARTTVERMRESGKKTTCMKCMKRYAYQDLLGEAT